MFRKKSRILPNVIVNFFVALNYMRRYIFIRGTLTEKGTLPCYTVVPFQGWTIYRIILQLC